MPTEGTDQLPYPNTTDAPDGPGAFLALAQRITLMKGAGIGYAATNTARTALQAADAFAGFVVYDAQDNAYYQWNGAAWVTLFYNAAGGVATSASTATSGPNDLNTTLPFTSLPFATVLDMDWASIVALTATPASARSYICSFVDTSGLGTMTNDIAVAMNFAPNTVSGDARAITQHGSLIIPANTAVSVKLTGTPNNNGMSLAASSWRWRRHL